MNIINDNAACKSEFYCEPLVEKANFKLNFQQTKIEYFEHSQSLKK